MHSGTQYNFILYNSGILNSFVSKVSVENDSSGTFHCNLVSTFNLHDMSSILNGFVDDMSGHSIVFIRRLLIGQSEPS